MKTTLAAIALAGTLVLSLPVSASAATFTHYGPPNAAAWSLSGHSVAGGAGTLPNEYPSPQPWSLSYGDYCTAYKFAQPSAPTKSAPFLTVSDVDLVNVTGFDPGVPREPYQLRHNAQFDSSACQAKGATWGFWANANTANNYCSYWCGVRHDFSTGMSLGTRPWSNGYGLSPVAVVERPGVRRADHLPQPAHPAERHRLYERRERPRRRGNTICQ